MQNANGRVEFDANHGSAHLNSSTAIRMGYNAVSRLNDSTIAVAMVSFKWRFCLNPTNNPLIHFKHLDFMIALIMTTNYSELLALFGCNELINMARLCSHCQMNVETRFRLCAPLHLDCIQYDSLTVCTDTVAFY